MSSTYRYHKVNVRVDVDDKRMGTNVLFTDDADLARVADEIVQRVAVSLLAMLKRAKEENND